MSTEPTASKIDHNGSTAAHLAADDHASYQEHDKLGPLGAPTSVLASKVELRAVLVAEFRDAAEAARMATEQLSNDTTTAVHEYRKSLRRARAVLALLADSLPRAERKTIREIIRDARRALSPSRDHTVAPTVLAGLQLDEARRATATAILTDAAHAEPATGEVALLVAAGADRALAQAEAIANALPPHLHWSTVAHGLTTTYRAARAGLADAKTSQKSFHAWRRRTKELSLQLDMLARHAGAEAARLRDGYVGLADELGHAVDLLMLREFVATHGQGQPAADVKALTDAIDSQLASDMKAARKIGKKLFDRGAKRFAKRVTKAISRDLAPPSQDERKAPSSDDSAS